MIDEIEIAPSNHTAMCVRCNKKIKRLQIRGKRYHVKAHPEYICEECLKKNINNIDGKVKNLENKNLEEMKK